MHTDANTLVKWQGEMSEHIQMRQGIRQGAKLSTLMYKRFNNDLLDTLQSAPEGVKIGTLDVSSPTCADDIALLTNKQTDAQILTNIIDHASSMDRFTINPLKSEILVFKTSKRTPQNIEVVYKQNTITQVTSLKHLGIERNQSNTPDIAKRIETARKTLYALLGSGMHGKNGISPAITYQLWITFVIPRLLHGIELLDIRKTDVEKLEIYQRKVLKQLQTLPLNTPSVAVLSLLGAKEIEAHIDAKIITTFLNIAKDPISVEHQLALRQLTIKTEKSASWFITAKNTLAKYDLPDPLFLLSNIRNDKDHKHWKKPGKKEYR